MNATFWLFNKKENSTKTPTATGTVLTIRLKDDCDVDNPVILCQNNVMGYNYMQFDGNYYFIVKKRYIANSLFEITATRDALATYKSEIKSSTQYVTRTNVTSLINDELYDEAYPLENNPDIDVVKKSCLSWDDPCYLLTVKGENGSKIYLTNEWSVQRLANFFYSQSQEDIWQAIGNLPSSLTEPFTMTFFDPFSYVVDLRVIPVTYNSSIHGGVDTIKLGCFTFSDAAASFKDITGGKVPMSNDHVSYTPGGQPVWDLYLRSNKASTLTVYLPGVGEISHNRDIAAANYVVYFEIDCKGHIAYKSYISFASAQEDIMTGSADISVPVAIYSNIANVGGVLSGVSRVVGATAAGAAVGGVVGAVGGFVSGAASAISSAQPLYKSGSLGSDGSRASTSLMPDIIFTYIQYKQCDKAVNVYGSPCMKLTTLSSNGFYLVEKPVVDFGDDLEVKNKIIEFMRSGFYVE